jgi:biotin operon repressor
MTKKLSELIKAAKDAPMSGEEQQEQRISFAYGNTHFENENITREMVREAADELRENGRTSNGHSKG